MLNLLERAAFRALSPAGQRARLSVLIFHRVLPVPDPMFPGEPDAARFTADMEWLKSAFNVLPLAEAVDRLRAGSLPARAAAITFDDGYSDNFTVALPILQQLGLHATFFVAAGYLDGGRMWNDTLTAVVRDARGERLDLTRFGLADMAVGTCDQKREALASILGKLKYLEPSQRASVVSDIAAAAGVGPAEDLMMTSSQLRELASSGMTVGAHTVTHPILARVTESEARDEMALGRERLEAITGSKVTLFAYPNGKPDTDYTRTHARLARQLGFSAACSTEWGAATADSDPFQIPRFTPWDRSRIRYAARLAQNLRRRATGSVSETADFSCAVRSC